MSAEKDIAFLREMLEYLESGDNEMVGTMIKDWLTELGNFPVPYIRTEVLAFALLMEARLREKDADKGKRWKGKPISELAVDACMLNRRLEIASYESDHALTVRVAVDHANICMFIADVAGALECGAVENGGAGWAGLDQVQMP